MSDYKYEMQLRAEAIAEEEFGKDFYSLPDEVQSTVYKRGMAAWTEDQLDRADALRDAERAANVLP